ncbi:hypothetical protein L3Q82_007076 [Scortum barcoo]|uniref:Uncharacterized protein n=1 Tax=Scortum barcoo TaxID=214431 RepID=A0ACB8WRZ3_9TELE|nr:hypothetical protein L3Q82_007076 [Scortum barcoo]
MLENVSQKQKQSCSQTSTNKYPAALYANSGSVLQSKKDEEEQHSFTEQLADIHLPPEGSRLSEVMSHCHMQTGKTGWLGIKIFILLTASPANAGLMWMLLKGRRAMTPSEVLGLNVSVVDFLYCLCLPLDIYTTLHETSEAVHAVREALFALNIFGCPGCGRVRRLRADQLQRLFHSAGPAKLRPVHQPDVLSVPPQTVLVNNSHSPL